MSWCEIPEFYAETFPKAAKQHRCVECRAPIEKGEKHLYYRLKFDGEFVAERQHMVCRELCMLIRDFHFGECIPFGGLFEEWSEQEYGKIHEDNREARSLMAQIKWRERKYRTYRRRVSPGYVLSQRKWGESEWTAVPP